jgi:hypothetical protein
MPNLVMVIPAMDHINYRLATDALDSKYDPSIRAAFTIGKTTRNKYYNRTNDSEVDTIAMGTLCYLQVIYTNINIFTVLHSRHKLEYFRNAKWEEDWIVAAKEIVEAEFQQSYALGSNAGAAAPISKRKQVLYVSFLL